jgi:vacuolar protein sorting-associated protein 53
MPLQMLLDKYVLTKAFEKLLSFHHSGATPSAPPAGFIKRVNQSMTRIDPLLKTLQVRPSPPEGLVQAYLIHIADRSDTNFRKVLELKGVRKADQTHLMELFVIHRDSSSPSGAGDKQLAQNSPLLTPLMVSTGIGSSGIGMGGAGAALTAATSGASSGLQNRFDAASLGEKLLSAARDGVERIGTGAGGAGTPSAGTAVGGERATMNENLRNIGKFFRRDIGGIGARFGKRDVTPTGSGLEDGQR